jgi:hypothetical protein
MDDVFDREKVIDCMFDTVTSSILAELEDGEKECSFLAEKFSVSQIDIVERFSYLVEHGFIFEKSDNKGRSIFSANTEKLAQIVENNDTFNATIEGLEKMDSYLN